MMSAVKLACVLMECAPTWMAPLSVSVTQDMFFHLQALHALVSQDNFCLTLVKFGCCTLCFEDNV